MSLAPDNPDDVTTVLDVLKAHGEDAAVKVVGDLQDRLVELEGASAALAAVEERLERLSARPSPLRDFEQAIQAAHHRARHVGLWTICPHPVCRSLEDFLHAEAKDRTR